MGYDGGLGNRHPHIDNGIRHRIRQPATGTEKPRSAVPTGASGC